MPGSIRVPYLRPVDYVTAIISSDSSAMDEIKLAVVQTLEKQGIISQLKAQLRAQVFIAVEEHDSASAGSGIAAKTAVPARKALLSDPDGQLAIQLILDLLDTCNLVFTKKVFQPELGPQAPDGGSRQTIAQKLGLQPVSTDEPLILTLLKAFKTGPAAFGITSTAIASSSGVSGALRPAETSVGSSGSTAPAAPVESSSRAAPSNIPGPVPVPSPSTRPAAPLPRLEPLSTTAKPSLAPLPQLGSAVGAAAAKAPNPAPVPATRALPEPSTEPSGYDEDFEEEPVEEEVEEDGAGIADDDDDDYITAMGINSPAAPRGGELGDGGRDRPGSGLGAGSSGNRGRTTLDADLMAGDRSFGVSNELAGLDEGNSGGLSYSADYNGGASDMRGSLSSSQAMLSPMGDGGPKVAKLEPLRPLGASKLSPLAPLAPLPGLGNVSSSLSSSKDEPFGAKGPKPLGPLAAPVRKSIPDIEKEREEVRRLALLQSQESLNNSIEVENRPRAANIYDAEISVSASMDDGAWGGTGSGGGARNDLHPVHSKGFSMDLRETGLSASDRSGDIEHLGVDLAETAEWH